MDLLFHIGLHKTATTTLQQQFFPNCPHLKYFDVKTPAVRSYVNYVMAKEPVYFDPVLAREYLIKVLSENDPNVISCEALSGPPWVGLIQYGLDHRVTVVENIKSSFPDAKVLIVIRRQDGLAKSFYRQYIKSGGVKSIERFYGFDKSGKPPMMSLDRFRFSPYLGVLKRLFGDNLLVLPFEEFVQNQNKFLKSIMDFIGLPLLPITLSKRNATKLGPLGMEITRYLNRFSPFSSPLRPDGLLAGVPIYRKGEWRIENPIAKIHDLWPQLKCPSKEKERQYYAVCSQLLEMAAEDNVMTDREFDLNLKSYEYY